MPTAKGKRTFKLLDEGNNEIGNYVGSMPRHAALKAAKRGHTHIRLRETGLITIPKTNENGWRVHIYEGSRKATPRPKNPQKWMGKTICTPSVKKLGIEKIPKSQFPFDPTYRRTKDEPRGDDEQGITITEASITTTQDENEPIITITEEPQDNDDTFTLNIIDEEEA